MNTKSLKFTALTFAAMSLLRSVPREAQEQARASRPDDNLNYQQALQCGTRGLGRRACARRRGFAGPGSCTWHRRFISARYVNRG